MTITARPVAIVEDDESVRNSLQRLLRSVDLPVIAYASAEDFLTRSPMDDPSCLILDIHLGGMSGVELLERLVNDKMRMPVVLITADEEAGGSGEPDSVTCLRKPFDEATLIQAIEAAISKLGPLE
jgi:FixJ family two-component response regulator